MLLLELAWRHLLGGRFAVFVRLRWQRWLTALLAFAVTVSAGVWLAMSGSPFWGALAFVAVGLMLFVLRHLLHRPLPDQARGAYASAVTFIAITGIALAVMTLIVVISVMDGFSSNIQQALLKTTPEVTVSSFDEEIDARTPELLSKIPGVVHADPYVENDMLLKLDGLERPLPVRLRGETPERYLRPGGPELKAGEWRALDRPGMVIIGSELARVYMLQPGDSVWLISSHGAVTPMGVLPQMQQLEVAGIFRSGFYEVDQSMVITGIPTAQELCDLGDHITGVSVSGRDPFDAPQLAETIKENMLVPLQVMSWAETRRNLYEAMRTEKTAMFIIESLLILIGSFNISSTLFMAIGRKTREIGVLMALGMRRSAILALFALEGLFIGLTGTVLGAVTGVLFSLYLQTFPIHMPGGGRVYYIDTIPVQLSWSVVGITLFAALALSLAASIYPARLASRIVPAQALRYE